MNVLRCRYFLRASGQLRFPALAGNTLRGALGVWSQTHDPELFQLCFCAETFPSGTMRPFLVRANHLNSSKIAHGELFSFALHLLSDRFGLPVRFTEGVKSVFGKGVGIGRGRAELIEVHQLLFTLDLGRQEPAQKVRVDFLSPTELKRDNLPATSFDFSLLFRRIHGQTAIVGTLLRW